MKKILFLLCIVPCIVFAQEQEYKLDDLITNGLNKITSIVGSKIELENSKGDVIQKKLDFLPNASVNINHSQNDGVQSNSLGFSISKSISLNEPTYFGYKKALISRLNSGLSLTQAKKQAVYDIFQYYTLILQAKKLYEIEQKNIEIQNKIIKKTTILYNAKRVSSLDLKQAKINLLNAKISLKTALNDYKNARRNIFNYLNLTDENYNFAPINMQLNKTVATFKQNLSYQMQKNSLKSLQINLTQQKLDFLPSLSASYSYSYTDRANNFGDITDFENYSDGGTFMLSASYNLINFFENSISNENLKRNIYYSKIKLDETLRNNKKDYLDAVEDFNVSKQKFELIKQKMQLATESLTLAVKNFDAGVIDSIKLDKAKLDLINAKIDYTNTIWSLLRMQEQINLKVSNKILKKY